MLRRGSFTGTQRKTNQLKQVVGAPKPASSKLRILSQGTSRCARHFFPLPLLLASSARRKKRASSPEPALPSTADTSYLSQSYQERSSPLPRKSRFRATAVAAARRARRRAEAPRLPSPDRPAVSRYSFSGSEQPHRRWSHTLGGLRSVGWRTRQNLCESRQVQ